MTYTVNPNKEVFNIDFDGTLTTGEYTSDPAPNNLMINKLKHIYYSGHIIIIWTARRWSDAQTLVAWLIKHDVPFHGIRMDKGGSDHYVDDKNMTFRAFKKVETV